MTPKEKAEAMVLKYSILLKYDFISDERWHNINDADYHRKVKKDAVKCAIASIDDIIEQNSIWIMQTGKGTNNFFNEVKKELKKINENCKISQ